METLTTLGEAVARRRKELGKTQSALAHETGLRQEELSRLENAHLSGLTVAKLLRVASALELDLTLTAHTGARPTLETLLVERRSGANTGPGQS